MADTFADGNSASFGTIADSNTHSVSTGWGPWVLFWVVNALIMTGATTREIPILMERVPSDIRDSVNDVTLLTYSVSIGAYISLAIRFMGLLLLPVVSRWVERKTSPVFFGEHGVWRVTAIYFAVMLSGLSCNLVGYFRYQGVWTLGYLAAGGVILGSVILAILVDYWSRAIKRLRFQFRQVFLVSGLCLLASLV
jgi:hypothetical protein